MIWRIINSFFPVTSRHCPAVRRPVGFVPTNPIAENADDQCSSFGVRPEVLKLGSGSREHFLGTTYMETSDLPPQFPAEGASQNFRFVLIPGSIDPKLGAVGSVLCFHSFLGFVIRVRIRNQTDGCLYCLFHLPRALPNRLNEARSSFEEECCPSPFSDLDGEFSRTPFRPTRSSLVAIN